ncbi:MAG TPA: NIPSNAP family protein [Rhodanobacteraceae bacterium]|nr:NIPSNAP family protein [Rhodanobacteraceae bacterium]
MAARRRLLRGGAGAALLAAVARTQTVAAATTALYRNQLVASNAHARCCAIVELRQYTLHPQRFDTFARLFEDEFVDPLEAAGMTVIGQFRDLDDPNRFVWLRGFRDMAWRARSLEAFYGGPVWKARRDEANANFTDTDNVLLLRPAMDNSGVDLGGLERAAIGARAGADRGLVVVTVYALDTASAHTFPAFFEQHLRPELARGGVVVAAAFETEPSPNNFPRLPVREGERVFVWLARFTDRQRGDAALRAVTQSARWKERVCPELERRAKATQVLRLAATPRSLLRG